MDSKPLLPIVLAGQNNLIDKLMFHTSQPLASRIIGRSHLEALKYKDMAAYINHHLKIAGVNEQLFSDEATLAIHEGSGGPAPLCKFPRQRRSRVAAANETWQVLAAEHVRIAYSELI
jgi:general secretion pathway protein A